MKTMLAFICLSLSGCSIVATFPTVDGCERVTYDRIHDQVFIHLQCEVKR